MCARALQPFNEKNAADKLRYEKEKKEWEAEKEADKVAARVQAAKDQEALEMKSAAILDADGDFEWFKTYCKDGAWRGIRAKEEAVCRGGVEGGAACTRALLC
eukprot:COSAG01_NODE_424_length_17253_cov_31.601900_6_plen_103_part_00